MAQAGSDAQLNDRRRYRKIFTRLWRNDDFLALPSDEKVLTMYVLSGPQTNRIGLFLFSIGEASEDLSMPIPKLRTQLSRVCRAFGWEHDAKARVIWIPSWWMFNDPKDNRNAFVGALSDLNDVPKTPLIQRFAGNLLGIPSSLHATFQQHTRPIGVATPSDTRRDAVPIPVATQEQEQEKEKEQEQETGGRALLLLWNDTVSTLPKVEAFSRDRLKHAKARLSEHGELDWWRAVFRRMDESDFLTGRQPSQERPGWRADIDFVLRPGTAGKVLEGKYDNRNGTPTAQHRAAPGHASWRDECTHDPPCSTATRHELAIDRERRKAAAS